MTLALFALLLSAVALAWVISLRRRPDHLPLALALSAALVAECGRAIAAIQLLLEIRGAADPPVARSRWARIG